MANIKYIDNENDLLEAAVAESNGGIMITVQCVGKVTHPMLLDNGFVNGVLRLTAIHPQNFYRGRTSMGGPAGIGIELEPTTELETKLFMKSRSFHGNNQLLLLPEGE